MTFKLLATADIHLTDNPRDEYRWGLFPWIRKMVRKHDIQLVALLGDLTDAKDKHAEGLTNRVADELYKTGKICEVIFDPGNHDGIQEGRPFFRFTNLIPNVTCLTEPQHRELGGASALFLPNTRDYKTAWADLDFSNYDYIFAHQTFEGCITENGTTLAGIPPEVFADTKARVYSGDIHVPQKIAQNIEYVGAPYRIRFGDKFTPRCLLISGSMLRSQLKHHQQDLHYPCINKVLIEVVGDDPLALFKKAMKREGINPGDQVKLRVSLPREDYAQWPKLRAALIKCGALAGIDLSGPELRAWEQAKLSEPEGAREAARGASPEQALEAYGKAASLRGAILKAGKRYLREAQEAFPAR